MRLPRFTPRQLEAFITVAEVRSFSAAGDRLSLTPSAISQLVAELEGNVGFKVFDRSTRKVAISAAGREFLGPARTALKHLRLADAAAADVRDRAAGVVRIAAPLVLAGMLIPGAVKAFQRTRPNVTVKIRDCAVEHLVDAVVTADVDLAVGPDRAVGEDVSRTSVFDSPWVLWCAAGHPVAARRSVRWSDLRDQTLVAAGRDHEQSVAQMRIGLPEEQRITPIDVVDNISTALGIAGQGLALTLAPAYVGALARPLGLVMCRVVNREIVRQVCLYRSLARAPSPAAEGFAVHLERWLRDWDRDHRETHRAVRRRNRASR